MRDFNLVNNYRLLDKDLVLFYNKLKNKGIYEKDIFIPSVENFHIAKDELYKLKKETEYIGSPDPVFEIIKEHFLDFIEVQEIGLKRSSIRPSEHITMFSNLFRTTVRIDSRSDEVRANILVTCFKQADEVWKGIATWIADASILYLNELISACNLFINTMVVEITKLPVYFPNLKTNQMMELEDSIRDLIVKMNEWLNYTNELIKTKDENDLSKPTDMSTVGFDEEYYRSLLNSEFGVELDELLSWYDSEVEKTRNEVFEIASKLKISDPIPKTMKEVNKILLKYAGPYNSPQEMFAKANEYLKRTRAICHEYIHMPEDEVCLIKETPEQYKYSWPWGGYGRACPIGRPVVGEMFLNKYNYRAITDGWLKINTLHEAYPGHHAQFVRCLLDPIPETMKIGAKHVPLMEGTAHRTERAFEFVFAEDQFYPLFVAYRRHHTSVRIKADLLLRYFGKPLSEVVKLYMDELDFEYNIARGQVKQQEEMQGYFNCYYYGMKKISDWETKYEYDKKTFTELLFCPGKISLKNFERFLNLSKDDKKSLLTDFGSLM